MKCTPKIFALMLILSFTCVTPLAAYDEQNLLLPPAGGTLSQDDSKVLNDWLNKAWEATKQADTFDPYAKGSGLRAMCRLQIRLHMFAEALETAKISPDIYTQQYLTCLVVQSIPPEQREEKVKLLNNVVETAPQIVDWVQRSSILFYAALSFNDCGKTDEADKLLAEAATLLTHPCQEPLLPAVCLGTIAQAQARFGHPDEAKKTFAVANEIVKKQNFYGTPRYGPIVVLQTIAGAEEGAGFHEDAIATAEMCKDKGDMRALVLASIAQAQAKAGDMKKAAETLANALQSASNLEKYAAGTDPAREAVIKAMIDCGLFADAMAAIQQSASDENRPLIYLATKEAEAGKYADAFAVADMPERGYPRDRAIDAIAVAQAKAGKLAEALATARPFAEKKWSSAGIRLVAEMQLKNGMISEAAEILSSEPLDHISLGIHVAVAQALAKAGENAEAVQMASKITKWGMDLERNAWYPGTADAIVVKAKAGARDDAAKDFADLVALLKKHRYYADAFMQVAVAQYKANFKEDAAKTLAIAVESLQWHEPLDNVYLYGLIAEYLAFAGMTDDLNTLYESIKNEPKYVQAYFCLCTAYGVYWRSGPDATPIRWTDYMKDPEMPHYPHE